MNAERLWEDLNVQERQVSGAAPGGGLPERGISSAAPQGGLHPPRSLAQDLRTPRRERGATKQVRRESGEHPLQPRPRLEKEANLDFLPEAERIALNVGGHVFETTAGVLTKDRWSILAALCKQSSPPLERQADGSFFIDRDWCARPEASPRPRVQVDLQTHPPVSSHQCVAPGSSTSPGNVRSPPNDHRHRMASGTPRLTFIDSARSATPSDGTLIV